MNLYTSLTLRYLKENKKRTIVTIIGIIFLINLFIELAPGDPGRLILGMNASPEQVQILNHLDMINHF